ncbi:MAG: hypothetical protein RML35_11070 [Chloroherpetonaceae bacterium]|nr:hypothetical protein [Chloroherpetonaceae bacterium]
MKLLLTATLSLLITYPAFAQAEKPKLKGKPPKKSRLIDAPMTATAQDGRIVILYPNGRWEFSANPPTPKRDSIVPPKKLPESVLIAMKELRKMQAATEVGITFQAYSTRMIDLKASVDEALRQDISSELKRELQFAVEAYADALDLWNRQMHTKYPSKDKEEMLREEAKDICEKYGIKEFSPSTSGAEILNSRKAIAFIWTFAKAAIEKAELMVSRF